MPTFSEGSRPVLAEKGVEGDRLLNRDSFHTEFDTYAYLRDFYENVDDPAMQMVLTFTPSLAYRLPQAQSMLDFGAGPTIHMATCFRNKVHDIYLADYLPQNRHELQRWLDGKSSFDWTTTLRMIATQEGTSWNAVKEMESRTRDKVRGVFACNCLEEPVLSAPAELLGSFDVLTTVFTLEYCCNTLDEYRDAIRRIVALIKRGGYFVMGGILEETWCSFGGRRFTCLHITKQFMMDCLRDAGLVVDLEKPSETVMIEVNGMFMIMARTSHP